jgi:hypothetical protein
MPETTIQIEVNEELMSFLRMEAFCEGCSVEDLVAMVLTEHKDTFDTNLNAALS